MATEKEGRFIVYDGALEGFAPETTGSREKAIRSQERFYEQLIEEIQDGGSKIISPRDVADRETSHQNVSDIGSVSRDSLFVARRFYYKGKDDRGGVYGPRKLSVTNLLNLKDSDVGRRLSR